MNKKNEKVRHFAFVYSLAKCPILIVATILLSLPLLIHPHEQHTHHQHARDQQVVHGIGQRMRKVTKNIQTLANMVESVNGGRRSILHCDTNFEPLEGFRALERVLARSVRAPQPQQRGEKKLFAFSCKCKQDGLHFCKQAGKSTTCATVAERALRHSWQWQ